MNKFLLLFRKKNVKFSILAFISVCGILLFQGQDINNTDVRENGIITDRWWMNTDALYTPKSSPRPFAVVTDAAGFDNFDMGVDGAEVSIANHPGNPLWFFTGWNSQPLFIPATHHTENGYDPWAINNPSGTTYGDPWCHYDSLGHLYYNYMMYGGNNTWVSTSTDNGITWGPAVQGCNGGDRNTLCADQTGGPYANYVYCGETVLGSGYASFWRSTNYGASFTSMTTLSPHSLPGLMFAVGPNGGIQGGSVYAVTYSYTTLSNQTYNFHRSTNGGTSFTYMSSITGIGFAGYDGGSGRGSINGIRTRAYPMIAADNSYGPFRGRFYVVWANNPGGISGGNSEIYLKYSTDYGSTWSSLITVNNDPGNTSHQWFPAVWCEKSTGYLYVKWYSTEENPSTFQTKVYATHSTDGGQSFLPQQPISNQSFPYPNVGPCSGCVTNYRGDYDGIVSNGKASMATWFDGRVAGVWGSFSGYYPDFAMKVNPSTLNLTNQNDSAFSFISIPAIKNYTDVAKFSASLTSTPPSGTVTLTIVNKTTSIPKDSLNTFPDSLRLRVKTSGGVTSGVYTARVKIMGRNGIPVHYRNITLNIQPVGLTENNNQIPKEYYLYQNYPNPFNPTTQILFDLPSSGNVKLNVYDVNGQLVKTLINGEMNAGHQSVHFNGENLASGIYFYKLETASYTSIRKMMLVK